MTAVVATFPLVVTALPASALPSATPDSGVYMVNGPRVDDIAQVGADTWLGGAFTQIQNASGTNLHAVDGLAVLDASGAEDANIKPPTLNGSNVDVYDLSLGPNGTLYAAGTFSYPCGNGKTCKNLVGINPATGTIAATYIAPGLRAVLATADGVFAGGRKLQRYALTGTAVKPDPETTWHQLTTYIDSSIRGHTTNPQIRAIDVADGSRLLVVGQFDWIDAMDVDHQKKVAVMVDKTTGNPDLGPTSWTVNCDCAREESSAFGLAVDVEGSVAYIGAGGNDWAGAFNISDGSKLWQTDANGSVQDIAFYDTSNVILGGHFTSVEIAGSTDESGSECPSRNLQDQSPCTLQPRLAAVDTQNGLANQNWHPTVCCLYRGVWATTVVGTTLHIGGEFTTVGGTKHDYYARFSVLPVP
jgi:hypothetical protein